MPECRRLFCRHGVWRIEVRITSLRCFRLKNNDAITFLCAVKLVSYIQYSSLLSTTVQENTVYLSHEHRVVTWGRYKRDDHMRTLQWFMCCSSRRKPPKLAVFSRVVCCACTLRAVSDLEGASGKFHTPVAIHVSLPTLHSPIAYSPFDN